jgi:hypothetical protein
MWESWPWGFEQLAELELHRVFGTEDVQVDLQEFATKLDGLGFRANAEDRVAADELL